MYPAGSPDSPYRHDQGPPQQDQQQFYYWQQLQAQRLYVHRNAPTVRIKKPFSHLKHVILDLVTGGAWVPMHLFLWLRH